MSLSAIIKDLKVKLNILLNRGTFCLLFLLVVTTGIKAQEVFSLKDCIDYALKNNISIQQSGVDIRIKEFDVRRNKAAFLPSANAYASHGYSFGYSLDYTTYEYYKQSIQSNYFTLNSDVTLFNGFRLRNNLTAAQHGLQSGKYSYQGAKDQVSLSVVLYYLNILKNSEQLQYAEDQLALTEKLYEKAKLLVEVGQETKSKELELKAQMANDEMLLVQAKNNLEKAYLNLKQIMNYEISKELTIAELGEETIDFTEYENLDPEEFIEESVSKLPEVQKAKEDYNKSVYSYKAAKSLLYPSLSGSGSLNSRYSNSKNPLTGQADPFFDQIENNFGQTISFGLSIPIFANLNNAYNVYASEQNIEFNRLTWEDAKIKAKNTIYEAYYLMLNSYKQYEAAKNSMEAQQSLFNQSNLMYNEGVVSFYDWQTAKNNLAKSESTFLSAKYDLLYRVKLLDYYQGKDISE